MKINKLLTITLASGLLLVACSDESPTTENENDIEGVVEESENTTEEMDEETDDSSTDSEETDDSSNDVDEGIEETSGSDDSFVGEEVGEVVGDGETLTRTVVGTNYDINETQSTGPFDITVLNAQINQLEVLDENLVDLLDGENPAGVSIQIEVANNSEDNNTIYPDQATIVTNNGDQVDSNIWLSDDVGGEFLGEVTKQGIVFFSFDGNAGDIDNVRYVIDGPHDEEFESLGERIEFSIDF